MTYDLNIPWPSNDYQTQPTQQQLTNLKNTIITNLQVGKTSQCINFTINESIKIPLNEQNKINPIPIKQLLEELKPRFPNLRLFSRITLSINDTSKLQSITKLQNSFDIISIQPLTEKALQQTALNVECDLISLNLSQKFPFFLKYKTIGNGIQRGLKYEINYSQLIGGSAGYQDNNISVNLIKKNWFNNVLQLIRSSRSRGLVVSSGAQNPLQIRNNNDILILLGTLGLDKSRAKSCITTNPESVLITGRLKLKSYKQAILVGDENIISNENEDLNKKNNLSGYKRKFDDTPTGKLLKKAKHQ
ncbi:RPP1 [Candida pseudojiufengensis]|uniref:RPP1 n=1 Tax=Candida pseudojiufengensis TaxID=497109 RepID=UPI002224D9BD|nr:RPP1 [Candida pseudojiufengensis]KAI5960368.1 RPP1 [Candida pseudojiufengensis]